MLRELESKADLVRNFAPSWFASVMGTGILALTTLSYSKYIPSLKQLADVLFCFNVVLFFVLLIPWVLRWTHFRQQALADLMHPVISSFYSTFAIGMLVLSADFIIIGKNMLMGSIFWFAGTIFTIFFSAFIPYIMFMGTHVKIDHINPGWFIPPVGLIVIPIAGSLLISQFSGIMKELIIFINYFSWGAGFFIYIALLVICVYRFILHDPLPGGLAPTLWINLGPIGAGIVALINLVNNSQFITTKEPFYISGFLFWGFGIWWIIIASITIIRYVKNSQLPYGLSWWAFTFPLGAYVASTILIAGLFHSRLIDYIGFALYLLLVFFWTITFIKTAKQTYHGTLFKSHK